MWALVWRQALFSTELSHQPKAVFSKDILMTEKKMKEKGREGGKEGINIFL